MVLISTMDDTQIIAKSKLYSSRLITLAVLVGIVTLFMYDVPELRSPIPSTNGEIKNSIHHPKCQGFKFVNGKVRYKRHQELFLSQRNVGERMRFTVPMFSSLRQKKGSAACDERKIHYGSFHIKLTHKNPYSRGSLLNNKFDLINKIRWKGLN